MFSTIVLKVIAVLYFKYTIAKISNSVNDKIKERKTQKVLFSFRDVFNSVSIIIKRIYL